MSMGDIGAVKDSGKLRTFKRSRLEKAAEFRLIIEV
jgi:hypothetical protein